MHIHLITSLSVLMKSSLFSLSWKTTCFEWKHDSEVAMGLLPHTQNRGLRMRQECRERFPRHRLQRKPLVSDPGMHHGTCVMHVPWCMSGSLTHVAGENVPGIPGTCATRNFTYLARGPCKVSLYFDPSHASNRALHLMLTRKLWSVFYEYFGDKWSR